MFKPYSLFIGFRYAGTKRRSQLVSFISRVSMLGMTVAVALLILVLSVMNGFDREMRSRILGLVPHITVTAYGKEQDWQSLSDNLLLHAEVDAVAPFTQLNGMLLKGAEVEGVLIYGIDPVQEAKVSIIADFINPQALASLADDSPSIAIGAALAKRLAITAGDNINIMVPEQTSQGRIKPRFARRRVVSLFETGTELDQSVAIMSINKTLLLMDKENQSQGIRIKVKDAFQAPRIAWELSQNIPSGYSASDWTRTHGNLYSAIQLSKQLVGLMLVTIIAVAAFNVVSALVMVVTDKRGDIAILRTLGASPAGIMAIFMVQGSVVAVVGTLLGTVLGAGLSLVITDIVVWVEVIFNMQFLSSDVYPVDYLPSDLRLDDVFRVCATAFLMSIAATLYPAWRASRVEPADALRHE